MYGAKLLFGMVCGALLIAAATSRPAAALEWNLEGSSSAVSELTFNDIGPTNEIIKARGYYTKYSDGTGRFYTGSVQKWDGGVGVWANDDTGSPNHGVDNVGKDNMLLFEFDSPDYQLTGFKIGWRQTDSDVEVWIGGADLGPGFSLNTYDAARCGGYCDYADLAALGFTKISVFQNVVVDSWVNVNSDVTGRYVIFAGQYGDADDDDYFKLAGIRGQEEVEVPEPGSMLILSSALVLFGGGVLRRRWRRHSGQA